MACKVCGACFPCFPCFDDNAVHGFAGLEWAQMRTDTHVRVKTGKQARTHKAVLKKADAQRPPSFHVFMPRTIFFQHVNVFVV
jgi:hypothetical protein